MLEGPAADVDLVITDVMMPEMSGTELCAALKGDPATRGIPLVLLTSKAERQMKIEGLELEGAYGDSQDGGGEEALFNVTWGKGDFKIQLKKTGVEDRIAEPARMPLLPGGHMLDNYWQALTSGSGFRVSATPVRTLMINSLIMALVIAVGKIAISIVSAYAISSAFLATTSSRSIN